MSVKAEELFTICSTTLHPFDIHKRLFLCIKWMEFTARILTNETFELTIYKVKLRKAGV